MSCRKKIGCLGPLSRAESATVRRIARIESASGFFACCWAVEERETGLFVGRIGLHYPEGWPDRELGWTIARKFWGRGLATEGARAAMKHAFDTLGWSHVVSLIHRDNHRSIRVAERLGERVHGVAEVRGLHLTMYRADTTQV